MSIGKFVDTPTQSVELSEAAALTTNWSCTIARAKEGHEVAIARINATQIIVVALIKAIAELFGAWIQGSFASRTAEAPREQISTRVWKAGAAPALSQSAAIDAHQLRNISAASCASRIKSCARRGAMCPRGAVLTRSMNFQRAAAHSFSFEAASNAAARLRSET